MNDREATSTSDNVADADAAEAARQSLLHFLLIQTYLDGGACYATSYRDAYDTSNALPNLLRAGKSGKLVQFMESKHAREYLVVSDRSKPPHVVSLTNDGLEKAAKLVEDFLANDNREYQRQLQDAEVGLKERLIYRLRQNYCKLRRRKANRKDDGDCGVNEADDEPSGVSLPWLVKKCPKELHMFARLLPNRPMGVLPFTKEWNSKVESILLDFIQRNVDAIFVVGEHKGGLNVRVSIGLVQSLQGGEEEGESNSIDLEGICTKLVSILRERGNPVGGLDVGNIMTDEKMRRLLGGRDLTTVVNDNPAAFDSVEMYQDEQRNNVWYCRLTDFDFAGANRETTGSKRKKDLLHADEVGTYSLTDATSALAMAKVLANAMTTAGEKSKAEESRVAIDMTAGVGGNTIGLCKIFNKVIAYEIDEDRIEFLKRNVGERVGTSDVDVILRCGDSVLALDSLHAELRADGFDIAKHVAVIIDPPFGGTHYRRRGSKMVPTGNQAEGGDDFDEEGLRLGDMPLSEVVKAVMKRLKPCAVGLKLPLSFDVDKFGKRLAGNSKSADGADADNATTTGTSADVEAVMELKVRAIRRLARNLFVVIVKSQ